MTRIAIARRRLLQGLGGLVVGFSLAPGMAAAAGKTVATDQVDAFLAIGRDGAVTLYSGKVDLGTGLRVAVRQMAAEELGIGIDRITLVEGDTALTPDQGPTGGSTGVAVGGVQIRQAAATARQALIRLAAERLHLQASELVVADGAVRPASGGAGIGFGELVGGRDFTLKLDKAAPLVDPLSYRVVGRSLPRPDLPAKLNGRHTYVHDFKLAGMLHGRAIRPPAVGAELVSVDDASIAAIPGARTVRRGNFLGVVADSEWAAIRAARALKTTWTEPANLPGSDQLYAAVRRTAVAHEEVLASRGDADGKLAGAGKLLRASYEWPAQSHASLGPSCAIADVRTDGATIWTASQATHKFRPVFARFLGLHPDTVRMIYLDGAGCYGMNGHEDAAADAALMSQSLGRPVRVQWMREDEHGWDPKGPPQVLDLHAALDDAGAIAAWETVAWLPLNTPGLPAAPLLAPAAAGLDQPNGQSAGLTQLNTDPPYAIADMRAQIKWLRDTPLRPSNLRAPGKIGNTFAVECFTDELAAAAHADPLAFRLQMLQEPRGIAVLRRVAERMGWQPRPSPGPIDASAATLAGRGIAYVHYKNAENFVALGMEVAVSRATGAVRVTRAVCAHDCGLMINPDAVRNQVEGNILQTISRTLFEEVTFDRARVTSTDWVSYPILTFPDVPTLEIELIDRPHDRPMGVGEAAAAPVAAAIGNAVFDAIGVRLRRAPLTPTRVKAALSTRAA
jgi:CO/xanthine dehydrogenase Mo-binding subunit